MWNGGKCGTSCTGDNIRGVDSRTLCAVRHDFLCGGGYNDDYNMIYWSIVIVKKERGQSRLVWCRCLHPILFSKEIYSVESIVREKEFKNDATFVTPPSFPTLLQLFVPFFSEHIPSNAAIDFFRTAHRLQAIDDRTRSTYQTKETFC